MSLCYGIQSNEEEWLMENFQIGDYVFAEDWCYGRIIYINEVYAEIYFDTLKGGDSMTFALKDLKHAEPPKRKLNYGEGKNEN
jgi:hypothetical protein